MTSSLVGSEMCIRDSVSHNPEERPRCGAWIQTWARSSHFVSVSKKHTSCLLYTSDAADDM
eukprot:3467785-Prorocentrum_lima.AAC.1